MPQVTPEVAAHLKEADVNVKGYDEMLDDVRLLASSGSTLWADPTKVRGRCRFPILLQMRTCFLDIRLPGVACWSESQACSQGKSTICRG